MNPYSTAGHRHGAAASAGPSDMRSKAADLISATTGMPGRSVEGAAASRVMLAISGSPPASSRTSTIGGWSSAIAAHGRGEPIADREAARLADGEGDVAGADAEADAMCRAGADA